ncbi:MAG: cyclic pyranopterin monophosphate synthase MoaC [Thermodesulfobacteriota bacterium]
MRELTHFDLRGRARMVNVSDKEVTHRVATASGYVRMRPETLQAILGGSPKKGDVLAVAQLAGIQAAKRAPFLIPLCHPVRLTSVQVEVEPDPDLPGVRIRARVEAKDRTGVEMEALTCVAVAALTVYDMCKGLDREMILSEIGLEHKSGGKSGTFHRPSLEVER